MTETARRVLITGASGSVGPRVVYALRDAGYAVRTLLSDATKAGMFPRDVQVYIGEITDPSVVQSAMHGTDSVVHMAALSHVVNPVPAMRQKYERTNVGGTANVVTTAVQSGVKRLVFFSTIAVYGDALGDVLTEDSLPQPQTPYAQTKLAAERIVLSASRFDGQTLGTVLRLGAVYGSRIKGNYRRLVQALERKRFIRIGNGHNRRTLVYDRDVARAAVLAIQHPAAAGRVYNVSDGQYHTLNEIINTICWALGRVPPRLSLPIGLVRLGVAGFEDGAKLLRRQPAIGRGTVEKYTEDIAVDSSRIRDELGFAPQYDLRAGWQEAIKEMRQNGDLD